MCPKCAQNVPQFHLGLSPHKFYIDCKNGSRPKPSPNAANCSILKDTHVFMCIRRPPLAKGGSTLSYTYRWADFWCRNNKDIDRGAGAALKPTLANLRLSLQAKFAETWRVKGGGFLPEGASTLFSLWLNSDLNFVNMIVILFLILDGNEVLSIQTSTTSAFLNVRKRLRHGPESCLVFKQMWNQSIYGRGRSYTLSGWVLNMPASCKHIMRHCRVLSWQRIL